MCRSCCSHVPQDVSKLTKWFPGWEKAGSGPAKLQVLDTPNSKLRVLCDSYKWKTHKNQSPEANLLPHISQENQNTQNNQPPINSARQMSQHNIATTTQPFSREWGPAAEGVALKISWKSLKIATPSPACTMMFQNVEALVTTPGQFKFACVSKTLVGRMRKLNPLCFI